MELLSLERISPFRLSKSGYNHARVRRAVSPRVLDTLTPSPAANPSTPHVEPT